MAQQTAEDILSKFQEDAPMLVEAGFIAVKQFDEASARALFAAGEALRPKSTAPKMGFAYIALSKLELKEARRLYQEVLDQEPDNYLAECFLGLCHLIDKAPNEAEGNRLIQEAMEKSDDPTVKALGKSSLEWFKEYKLKTKSSILEPQKGEKKEEKK